MSNGTGLTDLMATLAARAPGIPVLVGDDTIWDSVAIAEGVAELAALLSDIRVLAVLADNRPAWVVADLAALQAGVAHLPLPVFFTPAQMQHALAATAADALLTDQPTLIARLSPDFSARAQWHGLTLFTRSIAPVELPPGTAKISFTSGSTGTPKGVCLGADGLLDTAQAVAHRLRDLPIERHLCVLPLALLLENVAGVYAPILQGAQIHLPALATLGWQGMAGFSPAALQRTAERLHAHSVILVPELAKAWALYLAASAQRNHDLVFAAVGGARVDAALLQQARALGLPLYQGYGLTECGSVVCLNRPGDDGSGVGRALAHATLRVVDGEVLATTRAFLGYLGTPNVTPIVAKGAEYATGDLGHIDAQGHLHLDGRRKNLLITSFGRNVSPEWIEAMLLADPAIAQVLVVGEARPALAALIVPAQLGAGETAANPKETQARLTRLIDRINATLPDYARIAHWSVVAPFTATHGLATGNGRPMRDAIVAHHAALIESLYRKEETPHVVL